MAMKLKKPPHPRNPPSPPRSPPPKKIRRLTEAYPQRNPPPRKTRRCPLLGRSPRGLEKSPRQPATRKTRPPPPRQPALPLGPPRTLPHRPVGHPRIHPRPAPQIPRLALRLLAAITRAAIRRKPGTNPHKNFSPTSPKCKNSSTTAPSPSTSPSPTPPANKPLLRQLLLLADHNAYHLGELVLVRRALGAWERKLTTPTRPPLGFADIIVRFNQPRTDLHEPWTIRRGTPPFPRTPLTASGNPSAAGAICKPLSIRSAI